ncbi:MAG: alpha/beta hydrolase [Burkholderiales bacterium]|nr:alpha/beta hydrolase [Burkholderiales bacterium]
MSPSSALFIISILVTLAGCVISPQYVPEPQPLEPGRLPPPNAALNVPHLRPCTDSPDRTLHLNTNYPVTVLVHGCNGSAGRFRSLAQLYAFHGQQAVCFSYDDRESLVLSSGQLISALDELASNIRDHDLTVIGHSMGGLVARKAMERDRRGEWLRNEASIKLATISAPLAGIQAANPCGSSLLNWLSLGAVPGICWIVTGDNWHEITSTSNFIRHPGPLLSSVRRYLKVVTDERDTCRRKSANGTCLESDYIFSLAEQYHPVVDNYPQLVNIEVEAGHVEIVGNKEIAPRKLLAILQQQGLLAPTPPERRAALEQLLAELY